MFELKIVILKVLKFDCKYYNRDMLKSLINKLKISIKYTILNIVN